LDRVLKKCLAKDADDRWQTVRDLKDELVWIASGGAEAPRQTEVRPTWKKMLLPLAAGALMTLAALVAWLLKPAAARPVSRTVIALAPDEHLGNLSSPVVAISPDGANVVYVASRGSGPTQLFLRPLDALKGGPIVGTEGAASPFFSPDGQWIAFFAGGKLKKTAVAGGATVVLCDASGGLGTSGGSWAPDNTILFQGVSGGFLEISASGGTPHRAVTGAAKHPYLRWPEPIPGGNAVLFAGGSAGFAFASTASIAAVALDGAGAEKDLAPGGSAPRLAVTGDLIYVQKGTLMTVPFNSGRLELAGSPAPVLEGVAESMLGAAQYSLSASGTLVYVPGGLQGDSSRLVWVDRAGKEQPIAAPARVYNFPRLSQDGRRIAITVAGAETQVWLYDMACNALTRATFGGALNANPIWSPDGKRLAFYSDRAGPSNLFSQPSDGGGAAERLTTSSLVNVASSWSPDGQTIAYIEVSPDTGTDIWVIGLSDRKARPFLKTQYNETAPKFSPDGHWLAYASDESGRWEVYVRPYPGPGGKWQISTEGGTEPVWNPDGRELFYRMENRMMAVPVTLQPGFSADKPKVLFEGPWLPTPITQPNYDVSRDGQRFLMLKPADEDQGARQIVVVQNWLEELKKRKK
jgi:serine/threonine-protein kinase